VRFVKGERGGKGHRQAKNTATGCCSPKMVSLFFLLWGGGDQCSRVDGRGGGGERGEGCSWLGDD